MRAKRDDDGATKTRVTKRGWTPNESPSSVKKTMNLGAAKYSPYNRRSAMVCPWSLATAQGNVLGDRSPRGGRLDVDGRAAWPDLTRGGAFCRNRPRPAQRRRKRRWRHEQTGGCLTGRLLIRPGRVLGYRLASVRSLARAVCSSSRSSPKRPSRVVVLHVRTASPLRCRRMASTAKAPAATA